MGKRETVLYALTGLLAGLLSGFLGSGGGSLLCGLFYRKISPGMLRKGFALLMLYGGMRSLLG